MEMDCFKFICVAHRPFSRIEYISINSVEQCVQRSSGIRSEMPPGIHTEENNVFLKHIVHS